MSPSVENSGASADESQNAAFIVLLIIADAPDDQ